VDADAISPFPSSHPLLPKADNTGRTALNCCASEASVSVWLCSQLGRSPNPIVKHQGLDADHYSTALLLSSPSHSPPPPPTSATAATTPSTSPSHPLPPLASRTAPHWSWELRLSRQNSPTVAREPLETRAGYLTATSATSCTTIPTSSGIPPTDLLSPQICRPRLSVAASTLPPPHSPHPPPARYTVIA
jgi:hypothetical protein